MTEKERERQDADAMWRKSRPTKVDRPAERMTTVLSVRMPREVIRALTIVAREQDKGPSTLARELIEKGLALESGAPSSLAFQVFGRILERMEDILLPQQPWRLLHVKDVSRPPEYRPDWSVASSRTALWGKATIREPAV